MDNTNNSKKSSLLSQLRDFGIGPIIGMFISMLTVPITTRLIIPEEFGKTSMFTLVQTLFNLIALLGMDQSYIRFYNQKEIERKHLLYTSLYLPTIFCFIVVFLIEIFRKYISYFMFGQYEPIILWSFILFLPFLILNRFGMLSIRMSLRGKTYSFLQVFTQILNFIILLLFLFFYEKSFRSVVLATICSTIIGTLFVIFFCNEFSFILAIKNFFKLDKDLLKQLFIYGLPLLPTSILTWVMNAFDKFSLRTWCTFNELGLYTAAFKIVAVLSIIQSIFTTTWTPIAYKWYEENVESKQFERISTIVLSLMTLLFATIVISRNIIIQFLGNDYRESANIFILLLFNPVLLTVSETVGLGINFKKKTSYNLYISLFATILNVIGNYILVNKFGALGAAISTCISNIVFFWARILISRHVWYKFSIVNYFINILLLLILCFVIIIYKSTIIEISIFVLLVVYNAFIGLRAYHSRS